MISGSGTGSKEHQRGFQRIVYLLIWLVIVPTALLLAVGILMLVFWQGRLNLLFGILVVTLVGCLVTGGVLALVFLRREANLSRLQLDFVSKVSHELRTPLTSIRMFVEMLQSGTDRDPVETSLCLDVLQKETIRLSERIERLLDWGRMEAGRKIYEPQREEAAEVVRLALEAFDATQLDRKVHIETRLPEDLPPAFVDRAAMVDALLNLLTNAVKYSSEDRTIELRVQHDGRQLRWSVMDNGIGIPQREHNRIFQKFYRSDERLSRAVEGSGLGLAIVRHVALGHGGRVEVDSAPGAGSTFTMVMPLPNTSPWTKQKSARPAPAQS